MKSFREHIELTEDTRQLQKAQKTLKSFAKTLGEKGWDVKDIKEHDQNRYGQLFSISASKEKYPEPSDFRDVSMVMISVDVRFKTDLQKRASSSISASVYQKRKWQKVTMAKFWEYVRGVENEKEYKDRHIYRLQTDLRKGRISDEEFADRMKLFEAEETELNEVFDKPLPYKWTKWNIDPGDRDLDHAQAKVNSGGIQLEISFEQETRGDFQGYELAFSRIDEVGFKKYDKTGQGGAPQIFATVIDVIKDFVKRHREKFSSTYPLRSISFSAEKDDVRVKNDIFSREYKTGSRAKLYTRMIKKFAPTINATAKILDARDKVWFGLKFKRIEIKESTELNEVFDKPLPWRWSSWSEDDGEFDFAEAITNSKDLKILTNFQSSNDTYNGEVEMDFSVLDKKNSWTQHVTGEAGHAGSMKTFATVIDVIKNFIKTYNKKYEKKTGKLRELSFSGAKGLPGDRDSRVNLYDKMVKKFADSVKARYRKIDGGSSMIFVLEW